MREDIVEVVCATCGYPEHKHSGGYPNTCPIIATWKPAQPSTLKAERDALVALQMVENAMMRKEGVIVGYGWSITKLNAARPFIHAALQGAAVGEKANG